MEKQRVSWKTETVQPEQAASVGTPEPHGWAYNRPMAIAALIVAILLAVLIGAGKGVRSEYRQLSEVYAEGLDGSGYGVGYYAGGMIERAGNLCKIAEKSRYGGVFSDHTDAVRKAILTFEEIGGYTPLQTLLDAVDALNLELKDTKLDTADETLRQSEYQSFTDQFYKLRNVAVDYNEQVREYNQDVLGAFPVTLVDNLLHLPVAEEFS